MLRLALAEHTVDGIDFEPAELLLPSGSVEASLPVRVPGRNRSLRLANWNRNSNTKAEPFRDLLVDAYEVDVGGNGAKVRKAAGVVKLRAVQLAAERRAVFVGRDVDASASQRWAS